MTWPASASAMQATPEPAHVVDFEDHVRREFLLDPKLKTIEYGSFRVGLMTKLVWPCSQSIGSSGVVDVGSVGYGDWLRRGIQGSWVGRGWHQPWDRLASESTGRLSPN